MYSAIYCPVGLSEHAHLSLLPPRFHIPLLKSVAHVATYKVKSLTVAMDSASTHLVLPTFVSFTNQMFICIVRSLYECVCVNGIHD